MQVGDLSAFIESKSTWNQNTLATALSDLHQFLRFLFIRNILPRDFSTVLPKIRRIRQSSVPSVWEPELVEKLLGAVDRSSPRGKRDYAVLLLAARLGMRASDIKNLTLDNLHWDSATIEITQSKTGIPLALPMSEEVGTALIDYLRTVRMEVEHRQVFLKMTEPFEPFTERSSLGNIIRHWRVLAGIRFRSKQRKGLHSLRHTLATRLLHAQTPFHIISDVLGHSSSATTFIYAKADVETLRIAAIDPEEVCHVR
jgi:integrase